MSEEDAHIKTIFDAWGLAEKTRQAILVYADWLDENGRWEGKYARLLAICYEVVFRIKREQINCMAVRIEASMSVTVPLKWKSGDFADAWSIDFGDYWPSPDDAECFNEFKGSLEGMLTKLRDKA